MIVPLSCPITILFFFNDTATTEIYTSLCPLQHVHSCRGTTTVYVHFTSARHVRVTASIDCEHDALRSELFRPGAQQFGRQDCSRVERGFIRTCSKCCTNILNAANTSANCHRNEHLLGGSTHNVKHCGAVLIGRGNIEKNEFIRTFSIIVRCKLHRVSCIAQVHKVNPFDYTPCRYIKTGDNALGQHVSILPSLFPELRLRDRRFLYRWPCQQSSLLFLVWR